MSSPLQHSAQWTEISIHIPPIAHEAISSFLFELGCEGLAFDGSQLKGYLPFSQIEFLKERIPPFVEELERIFPETKGSLSTLSFSPVENSNWSENWRRFFHPEKVTPRLRVAPPWECPPSPFEGELIIMDPGPAFGTGQHATTRMCLKAMERAPLPQRWSMLDVGTGSGILAIYGAILGAGRILAVDIDPEALRWAKRNIRLNGVSKKIKLSEKTVQSLDDSFSLITANLTLDVISDLLPTLNRLLDAGGEIILSGLLRDQVERVRDLLHKEGLPMGRTYCRGEWASLVTRKRKGAQAKQEG